MADDGQTLSEPHTFQMEMKNPSLIKLLSL